MITERGDEPKATVLPSQSVVTHLVLQYACAYNSVHVQPNTMEGNEHTLTACPTDCMLKLLQSVEFGVKRQKQNAKHHVRANCTVHVNHQIIVNETRFLLP